jgi:hypothetical protein
LQILGELACGLRSAEREQQEKGQTLGTTTGNEQSGEKKEKAAQYDFEPPILILQRENKGLISLPTILRLFPNRGKVGSR